MIFNQLIYFDVIYAFWIENKNYAGFKIELNSCFNDIKCSTMSEIE